MLTLKKEDDTFRPGKDSVYRFLNSSRFNWRKFLLLLSSGLIQTQLSPLSSKECVKVLILHTTGKFVRGFRMLTLGWSDGNTFVPLCFSLLSSHNHECS